MTSVEDKDVDASFENETKVSAMVSSLTEYEAPRTQTKMITDPDLINVIDKMEELLRVLKEGLIELTFIGQDKNEHKPNTRTKRLRNISHDKRIPCYIYWQTKT